MKYSKSQRPTTNLLPQEKAHSLSTSQLRAAARKTSKGLGKWKKTKDEIKVFPRAGSKRGRGFLFAHKTHCSDILTAFLSLYSKWCFTRLGTKINSRQGSRSFLRSGKIGGEQFAFRPQDSFSATQNHLILSTPASGSLQPLSPDTEQPPPRRAPHHNSHQQNWGLTLSLRTCFKDKNMIFSSITAFKVCLYPYCCFVLQSK